MELNALLEITRAINANKSEKELYRMYGFTLLAQTKVNKIVVFYSEKGQWKKVYTKAAESERELVDSIEFDRDWLQFADAIYLQDTTWPLKRKFDFIIPVYHKEEALAYVLLSQLSGVSTEYDETQITFIKTITNIIIVAIENKRLFRRQLEQEKLNKEMEVAQRVQKMLIPQELPNNGQIKMHPIYQPHHNIGGDYYDVIAISPRELVICMADVSGKGIGAALLMANFQAMLRAYAKEDARLKDLVVKLNNRVEEMTEGDSFITLFIAKYNLETRQLYFINAGHPPPLLLEMGGIQKLSTGCTIVGALKSLPEIEEGEVFLTPGATIVMYTDGLTDLMSEEGMYFQEEHLMEFLVNQSDEEPEKLNRLLLKKIEEFKGEEPYPDDISILSWKVL